MLLVLLQPTDVLRAKSVNGGLYTGANSSLTPFVHSSKFPLFWKSLDYLLSSKQLFLPSANLPKWSRHRIEMKIILSRKPWLLSKKRNFFVFFFGAKWIWRKSVIANYSFYSKRPKSNYKICFKLDRMVLIIGGLWLGGTPGDFPVGPLQVSMWNPGKYFMCKKSLAKKSLTYTQFHSLELETWRLI